MTQNTEDLILQELFNLNHKIDKFQDETRSQFKIMEEKMATKEELKALEEKMATKEDIKAIRAEMATKEDFKKYATKEDLKNFMTREEIKKEFEKQSKDIADIFHDTFRTLQNREDKLRNEFILRHG